MRAERQMLFLTVIEFAACLCNAPGPSSTPIRVKLRMDGYSNRIIHFRNPGTITTPSYGIIQDRFDLLTQANPTFVHPNSNVLPSFYFRTVREIVLLRIVYITCSKLQEFLNISFRMYHLIAIEIKRSETFLRHCTRQQINNTMVRKFYVRRNFRFLIVRNDEVNFIKSATGTTHPFRRFQTFFIFRDKTRDSLERFKNGLIVMKR